MGKQSGLVGVAVLSLPVLEVIALVVIGGVLGVFRTVALFFLLSVLGLYVFRARLSQLATRSLGQALDAEQAPRALGSAVLAVLGGVLLIIPGFVTALAGIALQVAPLRALLAHRVTSRFTTTIGTVGTRFGMQDPFGPANAHGFGTQRGDVVDTHLATDATDRPSSPSSSAELN